jgi:DNA-binding NarL/FixJ family response regulator
MSRRRGGGVRAFRFEHDGAELRVLSLPVVAARETGLSPAELSVALAIAGGASNREIARRRGTSVRTVANQVASILRRLGLDSRVQVALRFADLH